MLSIELPEEVEAGLERLAERTVRTKSFLVREAILEKIENLEEVFLAVDTLQRVCKGNEKTLNAGKSGVA